jgi:hypothetical protein
MRCAFVVIAACLCAAGCASAPIPNPTTAQVSSKKSYAGGEWFDANYHLRPRIFAAQSRVIPAAASSDGRVNPATSSQTVAARSTSRALASDPLRVRPVSITDDDDLKPFTPEWYARQERDDARLRRWLTICSGC